MHCTPHLQKECISYDYFSNYYLRKISQSNYFIFTALCHASAVLAMGLCPSVHLSVHPHKSVFY